VSAAQYAQGVAEARHALTEDPEPIVTAVMARITGLASNHRYEDAGAWRDRMTHLLRGIDDATHGAHLGQIPQLMAAAPGDHGEWQVHLIRFGRLAGAGVVPAGSAPAPFLAAITAAAEQVDPPPAPATAALPEESAILWRWLFGPGVRLVDIVGEQPLALPRTGAGRYRSQFTLDLRDAKPPP
jgi:DNA polymerase-3 subunit epsilon